MDPLRYGGEAQTMAGYSGTPLPKKLGLGEGSTFLVVNGPEGFDATLGELPDGVLVSTTVGRTKAFDVIVLFVRARAELERHFEKLARQLDPAGGLWVAWPKKASGVRTDVTEDTVRAHALDVGLVDNKVCAIDATWSGLRLVYRVKDRPPRKKTR